MIIVIVLIVLLLFTTSMALLIYNKPKNKTIPIVIEDDLESMLEDEKN